MEKIGFYGLWAALGVFMLIYYLRRQHTFASILRGTLTGLGALILLHYLGGIAGYSPEMNLFNIMQAGLLGLPGVVLMTVIHFLL